MMRIGYLMNMYPVTSATFIRREIEAHENAGYPITRYAIREWTEPLIDPQDKAEANETSYLLSGRVPALIGSFIVEAVQNPIGMYRAVAAWWRLFAMARGGLVRHLAYLLEAASLSRAMRQDEITHLHAHWSTNTAAVALMAHRLRGVPFSFTAHGPDEFVDWGPSGLKFKVEEARFVAAISHFCKTQIALAAGSTTMNKVEIVRCGVDLSEFTPSEAPFAGAPFVCVGRLCHQKAQTLLLEATAEVASSHPQVKLTLIGDGQTRPEVEALIAHHNLDDHVTLCGWQDTVSVRHHLGSARALVLPSFAEGLPVVIMESFALSRPVISTFIAGIPELVDEETGWIIPAGSKDAIVKAMKDALDADDTILVEKGKAGRQRVEARHNIDNTAATLRARIAAD